MPACMCLWSVVWSMTAALGAAVLKLGGWMHMDDSLFLCSANLILKAMVHIRTNGKLQRLIGYFHCGWLL